MKSPLLIGVSALTLFAVSATLFAQTTTGSSLITEMKAAVRSFTLAGQLNPGVTDLQSAPVGGKKTGDMLTAGEYNRILELVGQGGGGVGGKFEITNATTKTNYYLTWAARWMSSPSNYVVAACTTGFTQCATLDTAAHDFCMISAVAGGEPHTALRYLGDKKYQLSVTSSAGGSSSLSVVCYDNIGTGGGGGGGGGLKLCAGNDVSCQTNGFIGMKCEVLPLLNQGKFENPNQWHYSGVAMKVENGRWYGSFPEYQNAGHFANVACDRVLVYDPSLSGSGGSQSNIIKGTASAGFTNGQPHSAMATVSFGRTCTNPVITVQSVNDSIACGTGAGPGTCSNSPGTTSEDLKAYFSGVTATDFKVYLSSMSGVWVGATSPQFGVNYIVVCD